MRSVADPGTPSDFLQLFDTNANWERAQKSIRVIKVSTQFVMRGEDDHLRATFAGLRERGIELAVEALMLSGDADVAKVLKATTMAKLSSRIKQLGGEFSYVAMDEPLWFGHHFSGKTTACHSSIRDLADQVAEHAAAIKRVFPHVRIGDTEPVGDGAIPIEDWSSDIVEWLHQYRSAVGAPLAFMHLDVQWQAPSWQSRIRMISGALRGADVPTGIVANGDGTSADGRTWTESANRNLRGASAAAGIPEYTSIKVGISIRAVSFQKQTRAP